VKGYKKYLHASEQERHSEKATATALTEARTPPPIFPIFHPLKPSTAHPTSSPQWKGGESWKNEAKTKNGGG